MIKKNINRLVNVLIIILLVTPLILFITVLGLNIFNGPYKEYSYKIKTSDGNTFRITCMRHDFPKKEYDYNVKESRSDFSMTFHTEMWGAAPDERAQIELFHQEDGIKYYTLYFLDELKLLIIKTKKETIGYGKEHMFSSYIYNSWVAENIEPILEKLIESGEHDFIFLYGEYLLEQGKTGIHQTLEDILEGKIEINAPYYTQEDIMAACKIYTGREEQ